MYHDPELPGGFQDADIEMAALTAAGDRAATLADQGICTHGWLFAPPFGQANATNAASHSQMPLTPAPKVITACTDSMMTIAPAGITLGADNSDTTSPLTSRRD